MSDLFVSSCSVCVCVLVSCLMAALPEGCVSEACFGPEIVSSKAAVDTLFHKFLWINFALLQKIHFSDVCTLYDH